MWERCGFTTVAALPVGWDVGTTVSPPWGKAGLEWHQERESSCCSRAEVAKFGLHFAPAAAEAVQGCLLAHNSWGTWESRTSIREQLSSPQGDGKYAWSPGWRLEIWVVNEELIPNITWSLRVWSGSSGLGSERGERVGLGMPQSQGTECAGLSVTLRGDGAERCRSHKRERAGAQAAP